MKILTFIFECSLKEELLYIKTIDNLDITFYKYKDRFTEVIYKMIKVVNNVDTKEELTYFYNNYEEAHFKLMCWYNYDHWTKTKIMDFVNSNMVITRETKLRELRSKKLDIINNIFELELYKYKNIDDYLKLEPLLLQIKNNYNLICLYGYDDIDNIKINFNKIINEEINKYYKRKKLLDELIEYDGTILPDRIELYHNILNENKFYELYNRIKPPITKK